MTVTIICYIIAFILFISNVIDPKRWNALGLGLAMFTLGHVLSGITLSAHP